MTLNEVVTQLFKSSVGGYFNREKFTKKELADYIPGMMPGNAGEQHLVMEIALPDGWWYIDIARLPRFGANFYDYTIPDDREQESRIKERLIRIRKGALK